MEPGAALKACSQLEEGTLDRAVYAHDWQGDSSGVDYALGDCWEYLQTVKTLNDLHLNSLSTCLTNYLTWPVKRDWNHIDQKDYPISYVVYGMVYEPSFYHFFAVKTIYNKLNRRKVLILYPIYPNYLAFQSNNFLVYFINPKGYWAVSGWTWGAVMLLRGIFYKQGVQKWSDLTGDWWHYRHPHIHAIQGVQCQQL